MLAQRQRLFHGAVLAASLAVVVQRAIGGADQDLGVGAVEAGLRLVDGDQAVIAIHDVHAVGDAVEHGGEGLGGLGELAVGPVEIAEETGALDGGGGLIGKRLDQPQVAGGEGVRQDAIGAQDPHGLAGRYHGHGNHRVRARRVGGREAMAQGVLQVHGLAAHQASIGAPLPDADVRCGRFLIFGRGLGRQGGGSVGPQEVSKRVPGEREGGDQRADHRLQNGALL